MNQLTDLRQSPLWGDYLAHFGWKMLRTKSGVALSVRPTFMGSLIKIQRPHALSKDDLDEIDLMAKAEKALVVKMEPSPGQDLDLLTKDGYIYSRFPQCPPSSVYINLTLSQDELWSKVSHSAKYSINRSLREGTTFEVYQKPDEATIKKFYYIAKDTALLKKFYIVPFNDYVARVDAFKDKSYATFVRDSAGKLCGTKFYLEDAGQVLYVSGGTTREARKHKSGYLLMWESILHFKKLGFSTLDLEGVDDPRFPFYTKGWGGFTHFKEKFGGEVIRFPVPTIKYFSPLMKKLSGFAPFSL